MRPWSAFFLPQRPPPAAAGRSRKAGSPVFAGSLGVRAALPGRFVCTLSLPPASEGGSARGTRRAGRRRLYKRGRGAGTAAAAPRSRPIPAGAAPSRREHVPELRALPLLGPARPLLRSRRRRLGLPPAAAPLPAAAPRPRRPAGSSGRPARPGDAAPHRWVRAEEGAQQPRGRAVSQPGAGAGLPLSERHRGCPARVSVSLVRNWTGPWALSQRPWRSPSRCERAASRGIAAGAAGEPAGASGVPGSVPSV